MRQFLVLVLVGAVVIVMLAAGALIVFNPASARGAQRLDYGQAIRIDDFTFAALDSERTPTVGTATTKGTFYIVQFQVTNHAKRVGFTFRPDTALLIDAGGAEYRVSEPARAAWFAAQHQTDACARELAAGEECITTLVYEVPAGTTAPYLRMSFGGQILDTADALLYGNQVIQLK